MLEVLLLFKTKHYDRNEIQEYHHLSSLAGSDDVLSLTQFSK